MTNQSRLSEETRTVKDWLDALVTGECDQRFFLSEVGRIVRREPDEGWDLLSLVDQYYRRGKITVEAFGTIKAQLQGLLVGNGTNVEISVPMPAHTAVTPNPAPRSVPTPIPLPDDTAARDARFREPIARVREPAAADPTPPLAPRAVAVGDVLRGRYRIQGILGRGGMGTVFAAIDQYRADRSIADQRVAIKVLHSEIIKRPRVFAELRREFQYLQSLSHPNIVRVHEFDRDGDLAFFTMEYLCGALLSRVLAVEDSRSLHRPYALAILRDVGAAVAHAHARGVVHGDLNPGNIFITDTGDIRVLDFGASHQVHRGPWISELDSQPSPTVATPGFASCQVLEGEVADARDDVYALACIAYLLMTGRRPFRDATALKARSARLTPSRPGGLDGRQWQALREGLHFDRDRRPSDVGAWLERLDLHAAAPRLPALQSLWSARPRQARMAGWFAAGAAMVLIAAGAWLAATNNFSWERARTTARAAFTPIFSHKVVIRPGNDREDAHGPQPAFEAPPASQPAATASTVSPSAATAPAVNAPPATASAVTAPPVPLRAPARAAAPLGTGAGTGSGAGADAGQNAYGARARIELAADNVEVPPTEGVARIVVRRSRSFREDVGFRWWTESGTAKAGQDFVPAKPQVEHIESGKTSVSLLVPLVVDPARSKTRNFYVVIDEAGDNAAVGPRTLTMVTIGGAD